MRQGLIFLREERFIKNLKHIFSIGSILFAYLFPLYGVLFQKWDLFSVIFFFWFEACIIALFQSAKFSLMQDKNTQLYLLISYFLGFQALFLSLIMNLYFAYSGVYNFNNFAVAFVSYIKQVGIAGIAAFFSYLIRFVADYIKDRGFQKTTDGQRLSASLELIKASYPDLGALLLSVFALWTFPSAAHSIFVLIVFIGIKLLVDLLSYLYVNDF
ncbi:hypothetical protein A3J90_00160 [candidate division WOR-1 bacterium RIFOXYC2_FULL_37_10]|uniref:Uncharacterized protein n=1 Tax=candidate division WOR-1 bacterium RIFOXYB2_FULL_37_13 TaxID=1802579 RepID=A0A1F4SEI7_UNCSA|nr:MAG: hypothetical protein A2246_04010 [candidate division WOR-1 bacterium RIFOXYA2_FULL_37_7]OGC18820.1 MAG: hypothetical protein A2310_08305 [candidate division WOR-1 bacterium RIFOXYB2_FULL_37_13]OGC32523.1 MAG: hypothetical protein A3J90_00160 [candidate division WOR-1 bacterium RIFOXYC2_FULL_37_10]